jgi:AcrR family transcriptional regulator
MPRGTAGRRAPAKATKDIIIEAALRTLRDLGYSRTTARAVAREGGFNQALIFYHFGSLKNLLLAALDRTSDARLERYRQAVAEAHSFEDLVGVAMTIYREDLEEGHMTVASEMIAGGVTDPELRPQIVARAHRWVDFVEEAIRPMLERSPFGVVAPPRNMAFALVAFYCGVNIFSRLEEDHAQTDALFEMAARVAPLLSPFFGPAQAQ